MQGNTKIIFFVTFFSCVKAFKLHTNIMSIELHARMIYGIVSAKRDLTHVVFKIYIFVC